MYVIVDESLPCVNDFGWVVKICPKCGTLTRFHAENADNFAKQADTLKIYYDECGVKDYETVAVGEEMIDTSILYKPTGWSPQQFDEIWINRGINYAVKSWQKIVEKKATMQNQLNVVHNGRLSCKMFAGNPEWLYVKLSESKTGQSYSIYAKCIKGMGDYTLADLHLIHHSKVDLSKTIDGLYTRNEAISILDTCLRRWNAIGSMVYVATPFVGYPQPNRANEKQIVKLWKWLGEVLDMDKTVFITRKGTFSLRRERGRQDNQDVSFLKKWGLLDPLTAIAEAETTRHKPRKKKNGEYNKRVVDSFPMVLYESRFHSKFYAGIVGNEVEVLQGSYNLHEGEGKENLTFSRYAIGDFMEKFIERLFPYIDVHNQSLQDCDAILLQLNQNNVFEAGLKRKNNIIQGIVEVRNKIIKR